MQKRAAPIRVQAAAVAAFARGIFPFAFREIQIRPITGRLIRLHAAAAHGINQQPADRERVVADHFRLEPEAALPRELRVVGILEAQVRRVARRALIRVRQRDALERLLDVPAAVEEVRREPVEHLGMRGVRALRAKILERRDEAAAKHDFPQAIHEHARDERVVARREPLGEIEARGAAVPGLHAAQRHGHRRLHRRAGIIQPVAARQHAHHAWLDGHRDHRARHRFVEALELRLDGGDLFAHGFQQRREGPVMRRQIGLLLRRALRWRGCENRFQLARQRRGILHEHRRRRGRGREAELPNRVLRAVIVLQLHSEHRLAVAADFVLQFHHGEMRLAHGVEHRPAALRNPLGLVAAFHRAIRLRVRRLDRADLNRQIADRDAHAGEDEVPVVRAAGALLRQRFVRQHLNAQRGEFLERGLERERVRVLVRGFSAREDSRVVEHRERRAAVGGHARGFQRGPACQRFFPARLGGIEFGSLLRELLLQRFHVAIQARDLRRLFGRGDGNRFQSAHGRFLHVREERRHAVKIPLGEGIVLVIVTLGAAERGAEPHDARVAHAVGGVFGGVFLGLRAALLGGHQELVVTGCDALLHRRVRHQIAGELLRGEAVERQVAIERVDHVIAIRRDALMLVAVITARVGVTHQVQPIRRHPLAVMLRREQPIDQLLVSLRRRVAHKRVHVCGLRRQTG